MAKGNVNDSAAELIAKLKEQARLQQEINGSLEGYMEGLKKVKQINDTINANKKIEQKIEKNLLDLKEKLKTATAAEIPLIIEKIKLEKQALKIIQKQTDNFKEQNKVLVNNLKEVNKMNLLIAKTGAGAVKMLSSLPGLYKKGVGELKSLGMLDMAKATKTAALQMGIFSKQSDSFTANIRKAAISTNMMGVGLEDLAKMQSSYSEELGRTVLLSEQGLQAMAEMAKASGLGAEGAAKMAADMENQGVSAEKTRDYTEQTMNDAHKMGLNASKVIKNMAGNMKMLNKYNFKGGVQGLAKMAKTATKLGVDMNMVAGMADKLFDIEGAVDMSAQLQVMGGEWSKLADPFKLMYMARNDMEGLMESMGKAAESSVTFNKANGEMSISAYEMHKLRKVAEMTGVSYEELATAGKNARKFTEIKKQMGFGFDKETQEFIANAATFKDGEATIMIDGKPKLVKQLTSADQAALKTQITQKASMKEMAEQSLNFDESLKGLIDSLKVAALPLIDSLNKELIPRIKGLFEKMQKEDWFGKIGEFAKTIGTFVGKISGVLLENFPAILAGLAIFKTAMWIANGFSLAKGFMMGTKGFGGGGGDSGSSLMDMIPGKKFKALRKASKIGKFAKGFGGAGAGLLSAGLSGYDEWSSNSEAGMSTGENVGRTATRATGSGLGAWGGAAGGAAIGTMIFPGVGTAIGALIGGIAGGMAGDKVGDIGGDLVFGDEKKQGNNGITLDDGIIQFNEKDKFMSVNDGMMIAGTNENGNKDLAKSLNGGGNGGYMKIEFGEIHFKFDELKVTSPGSPGVAVDMLKDPQFIRSLTSKVQAEVEKVVQGGKPK